MCFKLIVHHTNCETRKIVSLYPNPDNAPRFDIYHPFRVPKRCSHYIGPEDQQPESIVSRCPQHGTCCHREVSRLVCDKSVQEGVFRCLGDDLEAHLVRTTAVIEDSPMELNVVLTQGNPVEVTEKSEVLAALEEYLEVGVIVRKAMTRLGMEYPRSVADGEVLSLLKGTYPGLEARWCKASSIWMAASTHFKDGDDEHLTDPELAQGSQTMFRPRWMEDFRVPSHVPGDHGGWTDDSGDSSPGDNDFDWNMPQERTTYDLPGSDETEGQASHQEESGENSYGEDGYDSNQQSEASGYAADDDEIDDDSPFGSPTNENHEPVSDENNHFDQGEGSDSQLNIGGQDDGGPPEDDDESSSFFDPDVGFNEQDLATPLPSPQESNDEEGEFHANPPPAPHSSGSPADEEVAEPYEVVEGMELDPASEGSDNNVSGTSVDQAVDAEANNASSDIKMSGDGELSRTDDNEVVDNELPDTEGVAQARYDEVVQPTTHASPDLTGHALLLVAEWTRNSDSDTSDTDNSSSVSDKASGECPQSRLSHCIPSETKLTAVRSPRTRATTRG